MKTNWILAAVLPAALAACATSADDADGANDPFLVDGKTDVPGVVEGSAEACAVRKLANTFTREQLDGDVGLASHAAANIAAVRAGQDGAVDTDDDGWFSTLADIDAVKYVGPKTFKRMLSYTRSHGLACGDVDVQLLAINDFHGNLKPPSGSSGTIQIGPDPTQKVDAGGAEFLATHLKDLASKNPNTLVVAAGDIIGATPLLSAAFHDEPTIESMNLMQLAIASVGNHEFDHGLAQLYRMQQGGCDPNDGCQGGHEFLGAEFTYLAANVIDDWGASVFAPYTIRRWGNVRAAFIGLTLEGTPLVTSADGIQGLTFHDEVETINALVPELKARGVSAIVVLLHEGGAQAGLYNECNGISGPIVDIANGLDPAVDVLVTGHTHKAYVCEINGKLVTSAANAGRLITDIAVKLDENTGDVAARTAENVIVTRTVDKDAEQSSLIASYDALIAPIANKVVGSAAGDLVRTANTAGETKLGDVIADAQLEATRSSGAVAAFMNPGGVRADLLFAPSGAEQAGEITHGEAFSVQPFANNLITLTVSGDQLHTMLEQEWQTTGVVNMLSVSQGFAFHFDATQPIGSRVSSLTLDGQPIVGAQTYRITVNSFLAGGGDGFAVLKDATDRAPGPVDLDAFEQYLGAHTSLAVPPVDRVTTP